MISDLFPSKESSVRLPDRSEAVLLRDAGGRYRVRHQCHHVSSDLSRPVRRESDARFMISVLEYNAT